MKLIFGLHLDDLTLPRPDTEAGAHYCGPQGILTLLETCLGLGGYPNDIDYLRIEQYRQALLRHQAAPGSAGPLFYQKSFEADQFATATELLSRRDELLLAGWDFEKNENTPARLATLAEIEAIFQRQEDPETAILLAPGYADRLVVVLKKLDENNLPFTEIRLNEPLELLPCHFQRLFKKMASDGLAVQQIAFPKLIVDGETTDLQAFQRRFSTSKNKKSGLKNDGSLLLLRAKRADESAAWLAQLIRLNQSPVATHPSSLIPHPSPTLLISEKNRTIDMALIQEGQPSLGIQSTSLARPTLQILKLIPAFLWEPVNPFKILEFVSLAVKPLADDLATLIANQVAVAPGLQGEGWYGMINRYFEQLAENEPLTVVNEQRRQYNFWFERRRYDMSRTAPKGDVAAIFGYLRQWAVGAFEEGGGKNHSLLVLSEQSKRIGELLDALPEQELTYLELERIVRTIYEPSPVVFQEREAGSLPYVQHPGAFTGQVGEVWWCNFVQNEPPHFFSRWSRSERAYLAGLEVYPDNPEQQNARQLWQQTRPVLAAKNRLLLVLPDSADGETVNPHPLFGDLQAAFSNLDAITQELTVGGQTATGEMQPPFAKHFQLPKLERVELRQLGRPVPFLHLRNLEKLQRERETLTSLEALFYYPYQWFFKYKIRLNKSSILSVASDNTLMGNLAHRVFEKLLQEDIYNMVKPDLENWVERETRRLLAREGAVLLMYGREPDRVAFVNKLKYAAWSLITHIRDNGWRVRQTEMELNGAFPASAERQTPVRGIADLVLERGDPTGAGELAVVDLKWRGSAWREGVIRNREDLQLVLYARLVSPENQWAYTSYFILENGKMLARNNRAFQNITPIAPTDDHRAVNGQILASMEATWQWRMGQLANGQIEIRCRQTLADIEDAYSGPENSELMMDILEMKGEDAKYDDYRTLINLIE